MKQALVILLLVTLVLSKQFDSYVLTNDASLQSKEAELNSSDLVDVLKHNFGSLVSKPSENAMKFIKETGKTASTIFNPVRANFLILINGNLDKKSQEKIVGGNTMKTTLELENNGSNHLFDQIFNTENAQSLINAASAFADDLKKKEFYIFSQDKNFSNYFENFGVSISVDEIGNVRIEDKQINQVHTGEKFQKCVNKAISGKFRYDAAQNSIYNLSTKEKIIIDSNNAPHIKSFLSELCGMQLISSAFKKDNASFLAIDITSLPKIEKVLSSESYALAKDILAEAVKKVITHYEMTHKNNNFGQVIFAQEEDNTFLVSQEAKNMKVRILTAQKLTPKQQAAAQSYTLRAWFGIFFVAIIVFVGYALFNVEISKDSLLYAKFIAEERR